MDFDTQETVIEYGADRKIEHILPTERNDAHRLIEECMIAANVAAARFLQRRKGRACTGFTRGRADRLNKLRAFLGELGLGWEAATSLRRWTIPGCWTGSATSRMPI